MLHDDHRDNDDNHDVLFQHDQHKFDDHKHDDGIWVLLRDGL